MAGAIAIAAALSRIKTVLCPHCGAKKLVDPKVKSDVRVCPRCKKRFSFSEALKTSAAKKK